MVQAKHESSDAAVNVAIEVEEVTKRYGDVTALDSVSLAVNKAELFALLGPNGAGKTTLVHMLCTIHQPDAGRVRISGIDVLRQPRQARGRIGVVFQEPTVDDRLTVFENLDFHGRIYGVSGALRQRRINEALALVQLEKWRDKLVRTLSGGMKRRLELARALIHEPDILFLDEPTVGLDAQTRAQIWRHVEQLQKSRGMTVLVTTHYLEEVERADRICIIDGGTVRALGTPQELKTSYGRTALRVRFASQETRREVQDRYRPTVQELGDELEFDVSGDDEIAEFMREFGHAVRGLQIIQPSLESVYLGLIGTDVRDAAARPEDRFRDFGRRGGGLTR